MRREITTDTSSSSEHLCELQYEDNEDDDELNSSNNNNNTSAGDFKWTDETRVILANVSYLLCYKYTSENTVFLFVYVYCISHI